MSRLAAAGLGLLHDVVGERRWAREANAAAVVTLVSIPLALVTGVGLGIVAGVRRWTKQRAESQQAEADLALLARVLLIGLSAGLSLHAAFTAARPHLGRLVGEEVDRLLRESARVGLAESLRSHRGKLSRLGLLLGRAHTTGASVTQAVAGYVDELRGENRAATLEAARRLPVKLTIPLALLILPGFVVLTVGPSVLDAAQRLLGPVLSVP